ncbi:MAG: methyl-accepting chemotaxis protein, partial [Thiomicrorhabdus sp.]|nr:methyl-accepting chemotaxis protein [Thiomicrorhabdus sp.]
IAEASAEQATGVSQVHQAISQIDEVTQQNAALVEETSAASASMNDQSSLLRQEMSFFHIGGSAKAITPSPMVKKPEVKVSNTAEVAAKKPAISQVAQENKPAAPQKAEIKTYEKKEVASGNDDEWQDF